LLRVSVRCGARRRYTKRPNDRLSGVVHIVRPAHAGITISLA